MLAYSANSNFHQNPWLIPGQCNQKCCSWLIWLIISSLIDVEGKVWTVRIHLNTVVSWYPLYPLSWQLYDTAFGSSTVHWNSVSGPPTTVSIQPSSATASWKLLKNRYFHNNSGKSTALVRGEYQYLVCQVSEKLWSKYCPPFYTLSRSPASSFHWIETNRCHLKWTA